MSDTQFQKLNLVEGACKSNVENGKVVLNAATAKTCNFACKDGYYRTKGGTNIAFTCAHNGVTEPKGNDNWDTIGKCEGA